MTSGFSKCDLLKSPKRKSGVALSKAIRTYPQYTKSKTWHPRFDLSVRPSHRGSRRSCKRRRDRSRNLQKTRCQSSSAFENAGITKSLGTECQALAFGLLKSPLQAFGFSTGNKISVALEAPLDFLKTSHWRHGHCKQLTPRNDCGQQLPLRVTLL